ncbi:MAG: histidine phosphatase family protein [Oscillatoriales cyanobacterium C42_A2020_001]|nr:histidine phosphatase family protein [Leptolyngbyaceae cyanobacterium C42_A2020_001]
MIAVWLIRHGESESNAGLPTQNLTEFTQLTPKGHRQAESLIHVVAKPDLIVTSPYIRTKQTAQPILTQFPNCPQAEWQVQEFDYLSLPSKPTDRSEILDLCKVYWQRRDPFYIDGEGAESFAGLMHRVKQMFQQIQQLDGKLIVIFSHAGFIRAVLWSALTQTAEITPKAMEKFCCFIQSVRIPNAAIVKLYLHQDEIFISNILTSHLPDL